MSVYPDTFGASHIPDLPSLHHRTTARFSIDKGFPLLH
jgi:hypothetical protein